MTEEQKPQNEESPNLALIGIGSKERKKLKPSKCIVENVEVKYIETAKVSKAVFHIRHPDSETTVPLSSAFIMKAKKDNSREIKELATWFNLDEDKNIQKDSALAHILRKYGASNLMEMINKEVETETASEGYLTIKAY